MAKADEDKARRLAEALRQNLRRRKAQARGEESDQLLPGTGRETAAEAGGGGGGASGTATGPLHQPAAGPPSGED